MDRQARRQARGEAALLPALTLRPRALEGWSAAAAQTRQLYLDYVGSPWSRATRQMLARDTAIWAADHALEAHIQHRSERGDWVGEIVIEGLLSLIFH